MKHYQPPCLVHTPYECVCAYVRVCSMRALASLTSMASCVHSASVLPSFGKTSESWVLSIIAVFLRCLRLSFFFSVFLSEWVQKTQTSSPHFLFYRSLSIRLISLCVFSHSAPVQCVTCLSAPSVRLIPKSVDFFVHFLYASSKGILDDYSLLRFVIFQVNETTRWTCDMVIHFSWRLEFF